MRQGGLSTTAAFVRLDFARIFGTALNRAEIATGKAPLYATWEWHSGDAFSNEWLRGTIANPDGELSMTLEHLGGRQVVRLLATFPHFGGVRYWFECPHTFRRCRVLYRPTNSEHAGYACKSAWRIHYACQHESDVDRARRKSVKIRERLWPHVGGDVTIPADQLPKPKWMRWRTFNRLVAECLEADAVMNDYSLRHFGCRLDWFS